MITPAMHYSDSGLTLTEGFEKCCLTVYQDSRGRWTNGWGHTGPDVCSTTPPITEATAVLNLKRDVATSEWNVNTYVRVPLRQNQFDALVDFTFNAGGGNFSKSTLLSKLNAGDYAGADAEFGRWVYAGGQMLNGLKRRRDAEAALFNA